MTHLQQEMVSAATEGSDQDSVIDDEASTETSTRYSPEGYTVEPLGVVGRA
jgi:hypothetical protein